MNAGSSEEWAACKTVAKDYDAHPTCFKHRPCIDMEKFKRRPAECIYCAYVLEDHQSNPKKSIFSHLVNRLVNRLIRVIDLC